MITWSSCNLAQLDIGDTVRCVRSIIFDLPLIIGVSITDIPKRCLSDKQLFNYIQSPIGIE
jgi:hypothetical protein